MANDSIAIVAGPAGAGALCMLGIFLTLDGRAPNLFPTVETYAKTATWGVVAAVPILLIAYVLGIFLSSIGVLAIQTVFGPGTTAEMTDMVRLNNLPAHSIVLQHYLQLRQERSVLAGSAISLVSLCVGAVSETANLMHIKGEVMILAVMCLLFGVLLLWLASAKTLEAHQLAASLPVTQPAPSSQ